MSLGQIRVRLVAATLMITATSALSADTVNPGPIPNESIRYEALPGSPPGVLSAVLSGDLSAPGLYVLRNKWQPNSWMGPHEHGSAHRIYTVLEGEVYWGYGEKIEESKMVRLGPGSVAVTGPGLPPHYFRAGPEGMVVNVVAEGPFVTNMISN
jgi:hypothetical protein